MTDNLCACGCGTSIQPSSTFARGHYQRGCGGHDNLPPDEKACERCGKIYRRDELASRQSNKHWAARRFCGEACRRASRRDEALRGSAHPNWKGDDATPDAGRMRARRQYEGAITCEVCGERGERHHKNGNTLDNSRENVAFLCRKHHIQAEDRMAYRRVERTEERAARKRQQARDRQRRYQQRRREQRAQQTEGGA